MYVWHADGLLVLPRRGGETVRAVLQRRRIMTPLVHDGLLDVSPHALGLSGDGGVVSPGRVDGLDDVVAGWLWC